MLVFNGANSVVLYHTNFLIYTAQPIPVLDNKIRHFRNVKLTFPNEKFWIMIIIGISIYLYIYIDIHKYN